MFTSCGSKPCHVPDCESLSWGPHGLCICEGSRCAGEATGQTYWLRVAITSPSVFLELATTCGCSAQLWPNVPDAHDDANSLVVGVEGHLRTWQAAGFQSNGTKRSNVLRPSDELLFEGGICNAATLGIRESIAQSDMPADCHTPENGRTKKFSFPLNLRV